MISPFAYKRNKDKPKDVALALSSGGARGLTHIGVIEELEARGYNITSVSGTSIGAIIGGFYAAGKLNEYRDWVCSLDRFNIFNLIDFSFSTEGIIKGKRVFDKMSEWMKDLTFEDLNIPFSCIAADLSKREEVVLDSGDVLQAIRASIAIPGYFDPQKINGVALYDGGIVNPLPINRVARNGHDIVVAIDINAIIPEFDPKEYWKENTPEDSRALTAINEMWHKTTEGIDLLQKRLSNEKKTPKVQKSTKGLSPLGALTEMFEMMQDQITHNTLILEPYDVLIEVPRNICGIFEFHQAQGLIEYGRQEAKRALDLYENS